MRSRTASWTTWEPRLSPGRSAPAAEGSPLSIESVSTVGHLRVENWISWAISLAAIVYGLQTVLAVLPEWNDRFPTSWLGPLVLAVELIPLAGVIVCAAWPRVQFGFSVAFVWGYVLAELLWLGFVTDSSSNTDWIWLLCSVSSACAAQTRSRRFALWYTVAVCALVGWARVVRVPGGDPDYFRATMDFFFAVSLGLVIVMLVTVFRTTAQSMDTAAQSAMDRYRHDAMASAAEQERAEVDGFVHDTVLASLSSAVFAETPRQYAVSVRMASDAIRGLAGSIETDVGEHDEVSLDQMADSLERFSIESGIEAQLHRAGTSGVSIPARVAEAFTLAATQALRNSAEHAGVGLEREVRRSILVCGTDGLTRLSVTDNGRGFDPLRLDSSRLGVRVSIIGRMAAAGGQSRIESSPGTGTTVSLTWVPEPDITEEKS